MYDAIETGIEIKTYFLYPKATFSGIYHTWSGMSIHLL